MLDVRDMLEMQKKLYMLHTDDWPAYSPEQGKSALLWMIEEIGEVVAIIKKSGEKSIMNDKIVRENFIKEMSDVLMFFFDVLLNFDVSDFEFNKIYCEKHNHNLIRDYCKDDANYLSNRY